MATPSYRIKNLDHLGLVAGMCRELGLAQMVDAVVPKQGDYQVSHGEALVAMIINGLGFHSRTLHMFPQFFADKPTERLLRPGILPEHLNDDALGRCLDALFAADVSALYQVMAEQVVARLGLNSTAVHLDITSFHVDGAYERAEDDPACIKLVKGYSRDHRPELNQVILELICENQAGLPVYMQALSGNTNDQKAFAEVTRQHVKSLKAAQQSRYFVGDAALYTADSLSALHQQEQLFVTRVPMTLKDAKHAVSNLQTERLETLGDGYHGYWIEADYAGVPQRWLLVRSEQATKREQQTVTRNLLKTGTRELKQFQKLCKKRFACQQDAEQALAEFSRGLSVLRIEEEAALAQPIYSGKGRPKKGQPPERIDYQLTGQAVTCLDKVATAKEQAGIFILATNDLSDHLDMAGLLATYKSQQTVERGFRFLKSPEFLTSSLFLKKPERIEALLMVMTCSLMIYAALEHRIRQSLRQKELSFPDMKKKPSQNPTARWVFLCFSGIHELTVGDETPLIVNLQSPQQTILTALGDRYQAIYS
jgi:transposase